jgi:hypothetical protein
LKIHSSQSSAPAASGFSAAKLMLPSLLMSLGAWGPRLEHFLFHGIAALISREHATLLDLPRLYTDDRFRQRILAAADDPETLRFWPVQEENLTFQLAGRVQPCIRPLSAAAVTAGPDVIR